MANRSYGKPGISALVESWIGLSKPVAEEAIERASFAPNSFDHYCPRCGESVGRGEARSDGCASCHGQSAIADRVVRLGRYEAPLKDWIAGIKYEGWTEMAEPLGRMLAERVRAAGDISTARTIVVPVPMPWQRRIYRGLDHARLIAEAAARELKIPVIPLLAKRHDQPQAQLTRSERQRGRRDWIRARRRIGGWKLAGQEVILIDDVKTTGTTLRTCARLLRGLGAARIIAAVLAVTDSQARRRHTDAVDRTNISL